MSSPNLNHPFEPSEFRPHPAAVLQVNTERFGIIGAFVEPAHGDRHWSEWKDHPPTWMDPEVFLSLCERDAECRKTRDRYLKRPTDANLRELQAQMTRVFQHEHLPRVIMNFDHAAGVLAEFFAASEAYWKQLPPVQLD